jgi:hypothetical protein
MNGRGGEGKKWRTGEKNPADYADEHRINLRRSAGSAGKIEK